MNIFQNRNKNKKQIHFNGRNESFIDRHAVTKVYYRSVPQIRPPSRVSPPPPSEEDSSCSRNIEIICIYLSHSAVYR